MAFSTNPMGCYPPRFHRNTRHTTRKRRGALHVIMRFTYSQFLQMVPGCAGGIYRMTQRFRLLLPMSSRSGSQSSLQYFDLDELGASNLYCGQVLYALIIPKHTDGHAYSV